MEHYNKLHTPTKGKSPQSKAETPSIVLQTMSGARTSQKELPETPMKKNFSEPVRENTLPKEEQKREHIIIAGAQHILGTTLSLIQMLKFLGIESSNIILLGIYYSTHPETMTAISEENVEIYNTDPPEKLGEYQTSFENGAQGIIKKIIEKIQHNPSIHKIIFLDDGAGVISAAARSVELQQWVRQKRISLYGVEQTKRGHDELEEHPPFFPWISVATCDLKYRIESEFIAESIIEKVKPILAENQWVRCGIIGLGAIGEALAKKLLSLHYSVSYFDLSKKEFTGIKRYENPEELIAQNTYIFGCVGKDTLEKTHWQQAINGNKHFISCSSEDLAFRSLLRYYQTLLDKKPEHQRNINPLANHIFKVNGYTLTIHRGGFPINFDGSAHSVPPEKIILTRGMLLAAVYQWIIHHPLRDYLLTASHTNRLALDQDIQNFLQHLWLEYFASITNRQTEENHSIQPRTLTFTE